MATNFAKAVNSISGYVGSPYRAPSGTTLTFTAAHGISSSTFDNSGWVRVTIVHAGIPKVILKATAAPSSTTLTINGAVDGTTDNYTCVSGDVAELRITAGAFTAIHTAVNTLENAGGGTVTIGGTVSGGTNNGILYVNGSGYLADSGPTWDGTKLSIPNFVSLYTWTTYGNAGWIDFATTGPSGIGSGGVGTVVWIAYAYSAYNYFHDSNAGDIVYRNANGKRLLFGIDNGSGDAESVFQVTASKVNFSQPISLPVMANASAANSTLFIDSSSSNKLCWKDSGGTLHYST